MSDGNWYDFLDSGDFWSSAISGIGQLGLGLLQSNQKEDQQAAQFAREDERYAQELARSREDKAFELRLQALKSLYGSGGGGGGPFTGITEAQKVAAIQNQGELKQRAIADAMTGLQGAYSLGGAR